MKRKSYNVTVCVEVPDDLDGSIDPCEVITRLINIGLDDASRSEESDEADDAMSLIIHEAFMYDDDMEGEVIDGRTPQIRKINGVEITAQHFAWDGCHKIYLINSRKDASEATANGYTMLPIDELPGAWDTSCGLRFINTWDLSGVVPQFEDAVFEGFSVDAA